MDHESTCSITISFALQGEPDPMTVKFVVPDHPGERLSALCAFYEAIFDTTDGVLDLLGSAVGGSKSFQFELFDAGSLIAEKPLGILTRLGLVFEEFEIEEGSCTIPQSIIDQLVEIAKTDLGRELVDIAIYHLGDALSAESIRQLVCDGLIPEGDLEPEDEDDPDDEGSTSDV